MKFTNFSLLATVAVILISVTQVLAQDRPVVGRSTDPTKLEFSQWMIDPNRKAHITESLAKATQIQALIDQGNELAVAGKNEEAIQVFSSAIAIIPIPTVNPRPYMGLGDVLASEHLYGDAAAEYDKLMVTGVDGGKLFVGNEGDELKYALLLYRAGRVDESYRAYKHARLGDSNVTRGIAYVPLEIEVTETNYKTRQLEAAIDLALGVYNNVSAEFKSAAEHFEEAIRLKPNFAAAYFYLGETLRHASPTMWQIYGTPEVAFQKAASLGTAFIKQRSEQELGLRPPMTAAEAKVLLKHLESRLPAMMESVQGGPIETASPNP